MVKAALILTLLLFNATNSFTHYSQTSKSNFSMSSLKNAINIADDSSENSVVDLTDDKPSKKPKIDSNSNADMPHRNTDFIPFHLYNTKQSMGSAQYASRPQAVKKYFRTLRETIGFDGCMSERKFHWLVACNFLFDVHYFLQQTLPDILAVKRVVIFYGEGVTAQGVAYWNDLLRGSGNTVEFIRLIPSDPPRSNTNPLDIKIPYGVHHTKMFLVGYDERNRNQRWQSYLRVVVHTANMVEQDIEWKAQGIYSQNFPLKCDDPSNALDKKPKAVINPYAATKKRGWPFEDDDPQPFEDDLVTYLESYRYSTRQSWCNSSQSQSPLCGKELTLVNLIRLYDFSSAYVILVPSVPGKHSGSYANNFGYKKLQKAIKEQVVDHRCHRSGSNRKPSAKSTKSPVICQYSSVGSLGAKWLNDFVSAIDAHATIEETRTKSSKPDASLVGKMKIVWPTVEEIRTSIEGYQGGNSVPGKANNVNKDFLTPLYHLWSKPGAEYNNNADPLKTAKNVPHIKTFLQLSTPDNGAVSSIEWLCLTSHNLSKAAWGEFQNSAGSTSKVLFVRHWELGVFISPATLAKNIFGEGDCRCHTIRICPYTENTNTISIDCEKKDSNVYVITVPLPFDAINPEKYGNGDVPWTVDGPGKILPDAFGMIAR